jgi:dolichyl-phosphate beta-glucosyltransferase
LLNILLGYLSPRPRAIVDSERSFLSPDSPDDPLPLPSLDDPPSLSLSVIVPAFNEANRLPAMLDEAIQHLESKRLEEGNGRRFDYEIILVDDGSTDDTVSVALRHRGADRLRVIKLEKNRGKGGAVKHVQTTFLSSFLVPFSEDMSIQGMLFARGSALLFADADGASRFSDLDLLSSSLERIQTPDGHAVVLGSRAHLVDTAAVVQVNPLLIIYSCSNLVLIDVPLQ